ncbi:hypothetical protein QIS99_27415 [Streptomyces sp. B-S-A8]|uniref:DUF4383 domain-containing protein n=1 Tax=Streptomyces solicavernae TaxID=3043614 RepID=A0ABT6RZN2_9ACTN|nr:hypothetical protein [Streptomyces sp. B-S-A8]MDI3389892.1 hypothetical protein [Streptomyces sp. B-S-A8]
MSPTGARPDRPRAAARPAAAPTPAPAPAPAPRLQGRRPAWARTCLILLALGQGLPGAWALLWPRGFYDTYPLPGHPWVAGFPPYNEHLVHDTGAAGVALAVLAAWAARRPHPLLVRAAAVPALTFGVAHLVFHSAHLGHPAGLEEGAQVLSLVAPVVCAAAALLAAHGTPRTAAGAPPEHPQAHPPVKEETQE